eukprot:scaffold286981_cov18-Prasinocladus_malaysianus.AAC.1
MRRLVMGNGWSPVTLASCFHSDNNPFSCWFKIRHSPSLSLSMHNRKASWKGGPNRMTRAPEGQQRKLFGTVR